MNKLSLSRKIFNIAVLTVIPLFVTGCGPKTPTVTTTSDGRPTLTIWRQSLDANDDAAFKSIVSAYEQAVPEVKVIYRSFEPTEDYEKAVLNGLAAGNGPDVWEIRNDELARHKSKLNGIPITEDIVKYYKENFAKTVAEEMIADNTFYGMPLGIDPLVLFYNQEHFQAAEIQSPPKTWEETAKLAQTLTTKVDTTILRPGMALGTASNIDRASDILQAMMLQFKTQMVDPARRTATFDLYTEDPETKQFQYPGKTAFTLYGSFAHPQVGYQSWNVEQPYTTQAFAQGNISMMINYNSVAGQINKLEPNLQFSTARLPQWITKKIPVGDLPAEVSSPVYTAKYKALVVSKPPVRFTKAQQEEHSTRSWSFVNYANQADVSLLYTDATGLIPSRLANIKEAPSVEIAQNLATWYKGPSPRTVDKIFFDMIQAITESQQNIDQVFTKAAKDVTSILQ